MEQEMYQSMFEIETYHWYFKAKYEIVVNLLKAYGLKKEEHPKIIDFGCGCGLMLKTLSFYGDIEGIDFSEEALKFCKKNFNGRLYNYDLEKMNLSSQYNYGIALDVLEHVPDDSLAIRNIQNSLTENAICIFTVPAFRHLWSQHDENCMHMRRYNKKELVECISKEGFEILYCSYYNFWLYFPVLLIRKMELFFNIKNEHSRIECNFKEGVVNTLLYKIFVSEQKRMLKRKIYPFGVSLICVAKKRGK